MLKLVFLFVAITVYCNGYVIDERAQDLWNSWKTKHSKAYENSVEEERRFKIFEDNFKFIQQHNAKYEKGEVSFHLEMNQFADLLHKEFVSTVNGFNRTNKQFAHRKSSLFIVPENVRVDDEMDWRSKGAVTPIKNQKQCGSCWAFSATGSLEGQHFLKTGQLVSLSEQNLVDCSRSFGNQGCQGGMMDEAFAYIRTNHGIDTEQSYPYTGIDGPCRYNPNTVGADDAGSVDIPSGSESQLQAAVATVGPVSVAIDASSSEFQFYRGGVYYKEDCSPSKLDHGVLVIGYGHDTQSNMDYWLVKNSWGTDWGVEGFIKMARNKNNMCGIATAASYPIVK